MNIAAPTGVKRGRRRFGEPHSAQYAAGWGDWMCITYALTESLRTTHKRT